MEDDEFPFDLMEDIFCRLPVKSLLRFKVGCRRWLLLIKDPKFIKLHLQRSTQSHSTHGSLVTVVQGLDLNTENARDLHFPYKPNDPLFRISSVSVFEGKLCVVGTKDKDWYGQKQVIDIWVMEEYGKEESWTKLFSIPPPYANCWVSVGDLFNIVLGFALLALILENIRTIYIIKHAASAERIKKQCRGGERVTAAAGRESSVTEDDEEVSSLVSEEVPSSVMEDELLPFDLTNPSSSVMEDELPSDLTNPSSVPSSEEELSFDLMDPSSVTDELPFDLNNPSSEDELPSSDDDELSFDLMDPSSVTEDEVPSSVTSEDEIPFDLMEGILCRLPVKSLLRFKRVCRQWLLLIKDPKFIKLHLQRSTQTRTHTNLVAVAVGLNQIWSLDLSACNGLLCLANQERTTIMLWNMSTREHKILPPSPEKSSTVFGLLGFGYDPCNDDYKVVKFYYCWTRGSLATFYSLRLNSWQSKDRCYNFSEYKFINNQGVYLDGALNWRACDRNKVDIIISLDLNTEEARTLRLPYYPYYDPSNIFSYDAEGNRCVGFRVWSFDVVEGNLCVGFLKDPRYYRPCSATRMTEYGSDDVVTDIWVMKEYGNDESWTKLFSIQGAERCPPYKPLTCIHGDQVLLLSSASSDASANLFYYNLKQKKFSLYRDSTPALVLTRVSNELGAGNPEIARMAVKVGMSMATIEAIIVSVALFFSRHIVGYAYSNQKPVVMYVAAMAPLLCISHCGICLYVTDSIQVVLSG
ncbi:hypothetical protein COLO4_09400 [Corchorus olitorius]|uniref:F-box domain-containing protein n=1 Tax=Corchorus olitorius TaxID=93759 RepID=A0A1R3KC87_9ROSI|nr:hypothetical protein COLO4_09400 [Corchorus olitorius]